LRPGNPHIANSQPPTESSAMKINEDVRKYAAEPRGTLQMDIKKWVERLLLNPTRGIHP